MRTDSISNLAAFTGRSGKAALGALIGIAVLSALAGGAVYLLLQKPAAKSEKVAIDKPSDLSDEATADSLPLGPPAASEVVEPTEVDSTPPMDSAESERLRRIEKIKSGSWTTRRMVALTASGPYVIDFRVGIDGESLEEAERRKLDAIADQLLANEEPTKDSVGNSGPMGMGEVGEVSESETSADISDFGSVAANPNKPADEGDMRTAEDSIPAAGQPGVVSAEAEIETARDLEIAWADLLDKPLVAAGWLGNLIAEDEQRDQLISMYDRERDDLVTRDELRDFLSRGLSRKSSVQLADIGNSPDARDTSPWGPFDLNEDYVLDAEEAGKLVERFEDLDVDDDNLLTLAEARPTSMQSMAGMQAPMVLAAKTLYVVDPVNDDVSEIEQLRTFGNLAARVIEHYTFLSELPRDKWPGYPVERWREMDKDDSNGVDRFEMRRLFQLPADITIYLRFASEFESGFVVHAEPIGTVNFAPSLSSDEDPAILEDATSSRSRQTAYKAPSRKFAWVETAAGGRLTADGLSLQINVEDLFSTTTRKLILGQIQTSLGNEQIATALRTQFQLSDGALDLADIDGNGELDPTESEQLWQWITARQSTRLAARWMIAPDPWFQLLDEDADGRLSQQETIRFASGFEQSYGGGTAALGDGAPLLAHFTIRRADPRLENIPSPQPDSPDGAPAAPLDWFAAMDLNGDGAVEEGEFLGDMTDFAELDANKDGYLRRPELSLP